MSSSAPVSIRPGDLDEVYRVYSRVPEFTVGETERVELARRIARDDALVLVATSGDVPVGFKVGYDRFLDGSWYSWLGGVLPDFRQQGIASRLLHAQEQEVKARGHDRIYVKTRNKFVGMRVLLAREGYHIVSVDAGPGLTEARLTHVKRLV